MSDLLFYAIYGLWLEKSRFAAMKRIIITGSNGMIGKLILQECLEREDVGTITCITRMTLGFKHEKLVEVIHTDFTDYIAIEQRLQNQDICFYCIGVYTGQVPKEQFNKVTIDFTKFFSEALKRNSPTATFCFLSGLGADSTEKSKVLFAKAKGIVENRLLKLNFANTYIFRPGYIYPVTPRREPNVVYGLMRLFYKPVSFIYPNIGVSSKMLAHKMVEVGINGGEKVIYENVDIRN